MKRVASMLVAALACSACSGGLLKSDIEPPDVYRLSATEVQHGGQTLGLALAVARPRAPAALDTDRLAVVKPGLGFDYFAGMRWAEPAPSMLQQLLVQALAADGRFATTVAAPSRVPTELLLDVELRRFEAVDAGEGQTPRVDVEIQGSLVDLRDRRRVGSFSAVASATASERRRPALIRAFQQATDAAVGTLLGELRESSPELRR